MHLKKEEEKTKEVVMFKCDHCTVSFPHKFSLVKHLESAHDIAPKRNHTCEECGKNFSTPTSLKTHINKGRFFSSKGIFLQNIGLKKIVSLSNVVKNK